MIKKTQICLKIAVEDSNEPSEDEIDLDIANSRRDNLPSFHDVMKTYRWEIRCLSFFLAVAEANAFSAHSYVEKED
jgi:hypothetical protein